ncbi:DUF3291 domain-containing protein [Parvularcula sp. IMCC14364]|uniref:DUF3291 domain-containing protein n=1 Tax=Parvularcula sp. IMCC14364 TaxID=3067902 RepID=UPI0027419223|nr:DUF3291 domain-containing protein [Parvularcula sp. IMCC14364]
MSAFHLAQINIAAPLFEMDDDRMAGFANAIEAVNAFAEASPGFVWRLKDDDGPGTQSFDPYGDGTLINLSVWEDMESLRAFVYRTGHAVFVRRKSEWFPKPARAHMALWWVPRGHIPSLEESTGKLDMIDRQGPGPAAFTFANSFPPAST